MFEAIQARDVLTLVIDTLFCKLDVQADIY